MRATIRKALAVLAIATIVGAAAPARALPDPEKLRLRCLEQAMERGIAPRGDRATRLCTRLAHPIPIPPRLP